MTVRLQVLDGVRWQGAAVPGDRQRRLLVALAVAGSSGASTASLAEDVWPDQSVADPAKSLQVVVSRTRAATDADVVVSTAGGYRLGLDTADVDLLALRGVVGQARRSFSDGDWVGVEQQTSVVAGLGPLSGDDGAAAAVTEARDLVAESQRLRGIALTHLGRTAEALSLLEVVNERHPGDEVVLGALLRAMAVEQSPGTALERYEGYRASVAERLGVDPSPELRAMHRELLAADHPVREGLRFDSTPLVGRESDIGRLDEVLATGRVTSIVGAGGLGKTRLAQVLAQRSRLPLVHFVELVAVTVPDDLVAEVGTSLGVRDSMVGRETLTPEQRADTRGLIAQHLARGPSLLVLDNCEQVVEAVAELVGFLVGAAPQLRVLTTTRAPLGIAAERIYQLDELGVAEGVDLFVQRATSVRASVTVDRSLVAELVERLDGLPLAIELAAAQIRVMSLADIVKRIDDRFALLHGTDRGAPDRHQTLLNVLDWSWNLLSDDERHSLAWLSAFHDGFTLAAAEQVLAGVDALEAVRGLVDQSLLSVVEGPMGVRYRMLETVREFGRLKLSESGETRDAQQALRRWAVGTAERGNVMLSGAEQYEGVDLFRAEDGNLTETLRDALGDGDLESLLRLAVGLEMFWAITGNHGRAHSVNGAIIEFLSTRETPEPLYDSLRTVLTMMMRDPLSSGSAAGVKAYQLLADIPGESKDPWVAGLVMSLRAMFDLVPDPAAPEQLTLRPNRSPDLDALVGHENHEAQMLGLMAQAYLLENGGEIEGALMCAGRVVSGWRDDDGPWLRAMGLSMVADMKMQVDEPEPAIVLAMEALPILQRLRAGDDVTQTHAMAAFGALHLGDVESAERHLALIEEEDTQSLFSAVGMASVARAELELARGDVDEGLRWIAIARERLASLEFPASFDVNGLEPWSIFGDASALAVYAWYGSDEAVARLRGPVLEAASLVFDVDGPLVDYPVSGMLLFALGAAGLRSGEPGFEDAVSLFAFAHACGYKRWSPSMAWSRAVDGVAAQDPNALGAAVAALEGRRGVAVREDVALLLKRLRAAQT